MSILSQLASAQGVRSDVPNQELARRLAESEDHAAIAELAANLLNKDRHIQSDCIKTLYETGYLKPQLIAAYAPDFLKLLHSRNNRLVWGAMIALSTISSLAADILFPHIERIQKTMDQGSVITVDAGVLALAGIASAKAEYNAVLFPYLLHHLQTCRPKEVAQHAESVLPAVNAANKEDYIRVLEKRMSDLSPSQITRLKRCIKTASAK
ncbi:MAG TPA: hypothetical protein VFF78_05915 [Anaerolineaceae bacterium]|nr:hypothetical protein [Anaerolineaceae bacterium]